MRIQNVDTMSREPSQLVSPGRSVMRRNYDGQIISTVIHRSLGITALYYTESPNDGRTWTLELLDQVRSDSFEFNASLDSNGFGKYVAYSIITDQGVVGQIAYKEIGAVAFTTSGSNRSLTPAGVTKSFVAASRGQDEFGNFYRDVGYGWVDEANGRIYVGHSDTGIEFPATKLIHTDPDLAGGVSVATSGNFMLVVFQSRSDAYRPNGLGTSDTVFPIWMESSDGGETWSKPVPLFGTSMDTYPPLAGSDDIVLAGGADGDMIAMNSLAWERAEKDEKNIYVTSAMKPISKSTGAVLGTQGTQIGIVSVRDFNIPTATWKHVITHRFQGSAVEPESIEPQVERFTAKAGLPVGAKVEDALAGKATLHQYSALPYTPVRTLSYLERQGEEASIVVAMSTDSGTTYDQFIRVNLKAVGVSNTPEVKFSVSQCLFGGPNGDLYADAVLSEQSADNGLLHIKIPLGVNKKALVE